MKVMIFSGGYLPAKKYGGPVASLVNFVETLGDDFDIDIVCLDHDLHDTTPFPDIKPGFNAVGKAQVLYIKNEDRNINSFRKIIKDRKPDCLYLSSIFDYKLNLPLLRLAKQYKLKVIYAPRGELADNTMKLGALKKNLFLFAMRLSGLYKNIYFQATNDNERKDVLKRLSVPENMVYTLPNIASSVAIPKENIGKEKGSLRIIFLSRIHKSKNLFYAINCAKKLSGNIIFDIYGPKEHGNYWSECENAIKTAPDNVKISYCGAVDPDKSKITFGQYDCFLFPTVSENFSQAIAESVLAGTVPVISRGTTPWDDINEQGGFTIPLENPDGFTAVLQNLCDMTTEEYVSVYNKLCEYRKIKLDNSALKKKYQEMFSEVTGI